MSLIGPIRLHGFRDQYVRGGYSSDFIDCHPIKYHFSENKLAIECYCYAFWLDISLDLTLKRSDVGACHNDAVGSLEIYTYAKYKYDSLVANAEYRKTKKVWIHVGLTNTDKQFIASFNNFTKCTWTG